MTSRPAEALLGDPRLERPLLTLTRRAHTRIAAAARRHVFRALRYGGGDAALRVEREGVGDWSYGLDTATDRPVVAFARELGRLVPVRVLCEGLGEIVAGRGAPRLRVLVDPVDGTRNLMVDSRSAWILTGFAEEDGSRPLTTADLALSVQTEIPTSDRRHRVEFVARRGRGCERRVYTADGRPAGRPSVWRAPRSLDPRRGYFTFLRYLPSERAELGRIETDFFARAAREIGLDERQVYDDQWISAAGQLTLVSSGTMRMCADLRAWLAARTGRPTVASHPYDLAAWLTAREAGCIVASVDESLTFEELHAPLDLTTDVSFVAFANRRVRDRLQPILGDTLRAWRPARGPKRR